MFRSLLVTAAVAALVGVGCKKESGEYLPVYTHEALETNRQVFEVRGVVIETKPLEKSVVIKHDRIPNYMAATTMPFEVQNTNLLAAIEPGEAVTFRLVANDTSAYITRIQELRPKTNSAPTAAPFEVAPEIGELKPGALLPYYQFTNQFGRVFGTGQFKGQALAIEFLSTRCPFPTFCPRVTKNFEAAQTDLLARRGGPTNWHLLSITIDPGFDAPAVLESYAKDHHYDPAHWTFATGRLADITSLGDRFGLIFWHDQSGSISHNLRIAVINASGRLEKVFNGNRWTSDELVAELVKAARASPN